MSDILQELRIHTYTNASRMINDIKCGTRMLVQTIARAADEIERLRHLNDDLSKRAENAERLLADARGANRKLVAYVSGPVVVSTDDEIIARRAEKQAALDAAEGST